MKLAYHGATSMKSSLEVDIQATQRAGFQALEIWAAKIDDYLESHSVTDMKSLLDEHGVEPVSLSSIEFIGFQGNEFSKIKDRCAELCAIAEAIGCPTLALVPSPTPKAESETVLDLFFPWEKVVDEYVSVLRTLGQIAEPHGVQLSFEFLGFAWCSVRTPKGLNEIICKAGEQFGMTFDACHFFNGGGDISEIDDIDPSRICVFHLDDMEDVPKEAITDGHRLLPGEGILPLDDICQRLKGIGYDGLCCVELFRAEYWDWDPFELAKKAYSSAEKVLSPHFTLT